MASMLWTTTTMELYGLRRASTQRSDEFRPYLVVSDGSGRYI